jgi:hypothetical protein
MPTIGSITSNVFRVRNLVAFKKWFLKNTTFEGDVTFIHEGTDALMVQINTESPSAMPRRRRADHPGTDEWDLEAFAVEIRTHLVEDEEFRLLSCGVEHNKRCQAQHLKVTSTAVSFLDLTEGA